MARAAAVAAQRLNGDGSDGDPFYRAKLATAGFYGTHILPQAHALADTVRNGAEATLALNEDAY